MAYAFKNHYEYRKNNGRHDEDLNHVPHFKAKIDGIVEQAKTILFVGWRYDADTAYDHFDYTTKFAKVTLVEAFPRNCEDFVKYNKWNYPVDVVCADVLDYVKTSQQTFDVCAWFDGPEHVTYEEFLDFLGHAPRTIKNLIISTPNGVFPQGAIGGNQFECHKTTWDYQMMKNLGFDTAKWLADTADTTDPLHKQSALMGVKNLQETTFI